MATSTALAGAAFRMTAREAAKTVGGWVVGGDGETMLAGVSTDTRTIAAGNLFVALKGDVFDGHDHLAKAKAGGAAAALVSAAQVKAKSLETIGLPLITVDNPDDTLLALGKLGRAHRDRFLAPFVGITGSAGKSTAKEMTAAVLSFGGRKVLKTEGNLNNRIGVPLTVMSATEEHAACVIEMGISFPDEMPELVKVAKPDVRVVLNAGDSHLEFLKSPEGVAREKARIWDDRRQDDWMVYNADDLLVAREADHRVFENRLSFGKHGKDVRITDVAVTGFGESAVTLELRGKPVTVRLKIFGTHHAINAAAAAAVGVALNVPNDEIVAGLEQRFVPMPGRGDIRHLKGGVVLVDDSYNSNPTSATAALAAIAATRSAGRTRAIAALGDMLELGATARERHTSVGYEAATRGIDELFLFGPNAPAVAAGTTRPGVVPHETNGTFGLFLQDADLARRAADAAKPGAKPRARVYGDRKELAKALLAELKDGDAVLVKGSRGMKMDEVVGLVLAERGEA